MPTRVMSPHVGGIFLVRMMYSRLSSEDSSQHELDAHLSVGVHPEMDSQAVKGRRYSRVR